MYNLESNESKSNEIAVFNKRGTECCYGNSNQIQYILNKGLINIIKQYFLIIDNEEEIISQYLKTIWTIIQFNECYINKFNNNSFLQNLKMLNIINLDTDSIFYLNKILETVTKTT